MEKNLKLESEVPLPPGASSLTKGNLLVKVEATSINPVDYKLPEVPLVGRFLVKTPASPGLDFAGTITSTGPDCGDLTAGTKVFGKLPKPGQYGALGEYIILPTRCAAPIPTGVNVEDAATAGVGAMTMYQAMVPYVKSGDRIFLNGGSGGTGTFGIQIGKALGCNVATSCSTPNVALCKELGADLVIDYKQSDIVTELSKSDQLFDHIVDNVGRTPPIFWQAERYAKPWARFVQVGVDIGGLVDSIWRPLWPRLLGGPRLKWKFFNVSDDQECLRKIGQWMEEGKVKAVKDSVFAFEDAPKAYEKLRTGRAKGKIVVRGAGR